MAILVFNNVSGNLYIVCAEVKQIPKKINNRYISSSALICVGQSYIEYMQQIAIILTLTAQDDKKRPKPAQIKGF